MQAKAGGFAGLAAWLVLGVALLAGPGLFSPAWAGVAKIKGLHDDHERAVPLIKAPVTELARGGTIFSVIGGDYGFTLQDGSGGVVRHFENSQDAVGLALPPGKYRVVPDISGDLHHHQFIEVLIRTK